MDWKPKDWQVDGLFDPLQEDAALIFDFQRAITGANIHDADGIIARYRRALQQAREKRAQIGTEGDEYRGCYEASMKRWMNDAHYYTELMQKEIAYWTQKRSKQL